MSGIFIKGAQDGTPCGSGQSCLNGKCVNNSLSPTGPCIYGDDFTASTDLGNVITYPSPLITCSAAIQLIIKNGLDPAFFCKNQLFSFGSTCCKTCSGTFYNRQCRLNKSNILHSI